MMKRTDEHKPSAIIPENYQYICVATMHITDLADAYFIQAERAKFLAHQKRTGGTYATHLHGGSCDCCGASAVYLCLFYHQKSNQYLHIGHICADKLDLGYDGNGMNLFRKQVKEARKQVAGQKKAQAILSDLNISSAYDLYKAPWSESFRFEETTIRDIVGKLVRYGQISEKQTKFLVNLVDQLNNRAAVEAKRAEEKEQAADAPQGEAVFTGTFLKSKFQDGFYGGSYKMLVKSDTGFLAYGAHPTKLDEIKSGDKITFVAKFTPSKNDPKFAYFKRPKKIAFISE